MQQVKSSLEQKIKQMQISLTGEPVLRLTGLSAATLPHMDYEVAGTPAQRKVWQDKIDQQGAELKARRTAVMIYCPSCGHVAHTRRAHFMDDGTKIMIARADVYCSATFEASESFFSDSKDSGMEYISGKREYRDSLTSASGSMKRPKRMLVTGYCCRRCKGLALSRTSRRLSQEVTERFYVCTDPGLWSGV